MTPAHRYERVRERDLDPADPVMAALRAVLDGASEPAEVVEALRLWGDDAHHVIDAYFLVDGEVEPAAEAFRIPAPVLEVYRHLFFDAGIFRNVFERRRFARVVGGADEELAAVYTAALLDGPEHLLAKFRIGKGPAPAIAEIAEELLVDQYRRAQEHKGRALTSPTAREAHKWARSAASLAIQMQQTDLASRSQKDVKQFIVALQYADHTDNAAVDPDTLVSG